MAGFARLDAYIQWNLSYPGSVGPRGARNFKIARNSELIHELCMYSTWLYKNTGHKYIKHKNVYMYGIRNIYESGWAK